ncbi:MAG: DUF6884 domain-containing protein [Pseudomonadota bacterium]
MRTLGVVPCGKEKVWDRNPTRGAVSAAEAYTGRLHKLARAYAERFTDEGVILSAKYGFLDPGDLVSGPYDVTFNRRGDPRCTASEQLHEQVRRKGLDRFGRVVVIGGSEYAKRVRDAFQGTGVEVVTPLYGKGGIGSMQGWLKRMVTSDPAHRTES